MQQASNPNVAVQRLQKELMDLMGGDGVGDGVSAFPRGDDLFTWDATLAGPAGTFYDGIEYKLALEFTTEYPFAAPKVRFVTPCYHPNVSLGGAICLDILGEAWSAVMSVSSVLLSLQALLECPNNNSPLNEAASKNWSNGDFMRTEALRVAGMTTSDNAAGSSFANTAPAGSAPTEAATTNAAPTTASSVQDASASANSSIAATAAAAIVSMSPQEQRSRAHRHEAEQGGPQPQPPHVVSVSATQ